MLFLVLSSYKVCYFSVFYSIKLKAGLDDMDNIYIMIYFLFSNSQNVENLFKNHTIIFQTLIIVIYVVIESLLGRNYSLENNQNNLNNSSPFF